MCSWHPTLACPIPQGCLTTLKNPQIFVVKTETFPLFSLLSISKVMLICSVSICIMYLMVIIVPYCNLLNVGFRKWKLFVLKLEKTLLNHYAGSKLGGSAVTLVIKRRTYLGYSGCFFFVVVVVGFWGRGVNQKQPTSLSKTYCDHLKFAPIST